MQFRTGNVTSFLPILTIRDVVGDGRPEILSCADGHAFALAYDGANYADVWYSGAVGCWAMTVGDRGNGAQTVYVGTSTGSYPSGGPGYLYAFDPTSYGPELAKVQVSAKEQVNDVAVGNTDADPASEVVAITATHLYVYDAATLAPKWDAPYGGTKVAIGDVDGDGVPEIIVSGDDGHVLNGVTHAYEWGYDGGFGAAMVLADVDNDGKPEIVGSRRYQSGILIVDGDTLTARMLPFPFWAESLAVADANNDGQPELILGRDQWSGIEAYDFNGTKLWSFNSSWYGEQALAVGDVDGDGKNDVVWASGSGLSSGPYEIYVGEANRQTFKYRIGSFGNYGAAAAGDLDGDGRPELVVTANAAGSGYPADKVRVLDYATHRLLRKGINDVYARIGQIAIGQVDADPQREIIVLSDAINIYDGTTLAKKWSGNVQANHLIVRDLNGDGMDEVLFASFNSVGVRAGGTGTVTYPITALDSNVLDMGLADIDGDSVPDLVICTGGGIYIYKTSDWSRRMYTATSAFNHVAATAGRFAASQYAGGFTVYSGATLAPEWSCSSNYVYDLEFVTLGGQTRLATAMDDSTVRFYPLGGSSCPAYDTVNGPWAYGGLSLAFTDADGDGRPELFVQTYYDATILSLGWSSEPRGDADADGLVTDADVDALAAYFYGNRPSAPPMADVNADGAIRPNDLFYLINYRRGTGPAPPQ